MTDQGPDITGDDEADLTAAEHVLGLLTGDAHASAAERARADPAFAAKVAAWERRLGPLAGEIAPTAPPAALWGRIAAQIAPSPAIGTNVVGFVPRTRLLDSLTAWRAATAAAVLAAASLVIVVLQPSRPPSLPSTQQVATLSSAGGKTLYVATLDPARGAVTVVPIGDIETKGRSPEVWIIPPGGKPKPVGVLAISGPERLPMSAAIKADATPTALVAVSLEPRGGSPTGSPTGPVIASGQLKSV